MFFVVVQIIDYILTGRWTFLLVLFFISLFEYGTHIHFYRKYKPYKNDFRIPVSIVVSVFREKPDLLSKCLESVKNQLMKDDEIIVVFDGSDKELQKLAQEYTTNIHVKEHSGKRQTLAYGCDRAKNSLILTIDSDTIICPTCLNEIIMPFKDKKIGAVSAQNRIIDGDSNWTSRLADMHEIMSHFFVQKATSAAGNVPVLYGRCLAIRKEVWNIIANNYREKMFLGKKVESGDDNDLTILTIKSGYRTFMQFTARAFSDCPRTFWKRIHQQYRFNRSFIRATIDWINNPEVIWRAKLGFMNQITAIGLPFLVVIVWLEWIYHIMTGYTTVIEVSGFLGAMLTIMTLTTVLMMRTIPIMQAKKSVFEWFVFSFYAWLIMNILNVLSVLTIWKENPGMIQYSRND